MMREVHGLRAAESRNARDRNAGVVIRDLTVTTADGAVDIVRRLSLDIGRGETVGVVGESGSGKTTFALALLGFARAGLKISSGTVTIDNVNISVLSRRELARVRGSHVAYVAQDASAALNPALTIGTQLREVKRSQSAESNEAGAHESEIGRLLERVKLASDRDMLRRYPHQLSGGQQQRFMIAMALAASPKAIVFDEPTTGLDVITQQQLLSLIQELVGDLAISAVYVSHDISIVEQLCRRIAVMYSGRIVEYAPTGQLLSRPAHPYTRALLRCVPSMTAPRALEGIAGSAPAPDSRPSGCAYAPRCPLAIEICWSAPPPTVGVDVDHSAECHRTSVVEDRIAPRQIRRRRHTKLHRRSLEVRSLSAWHGDVQVLDDINLRLEGSRALAIVGESGSGKTTLAKALVGLHGRYDGEIRLDGRRLRHLAQHRVASERQAIQYVFQNPYGSLNPRRTVGQILEQPALLFPSTVKSPRVRAAEALERVGLGASYMSAYPRSLSGGERQRVAISRSLIAQPSFLICDEVTASLDVSVQATLMNLLLTLHSELGMGLLFITHQLSLVPMISEVSVVIDHGRIVEEGRTADIIDHPRSTYATELISAARHIYG